MSTTAPPPSADGPNALVITTIINVTDEDRSLQDLAITDNGNLLPNLDKMLYAAVKWNWLQLPKDDTFDLGQSTTKRCTLILA
jgi:hypothetical protein